MVNKNLLLLLISLLPCSALAVEEGEMRLGNVVWSHFGSIAGPLVQTEDGLKQMRITGGFNLGVPTVYESDNSLFPVGKSFASNVLVFAETVGSKVTLKGRNIWWDGEGNNLFGIVRRNDGTLKGFGAGGAGLIIITGGSGLYENIRGKCSYVIKFRGKGGGERRFANVPIHCKWIKRD